MMIAIRGLRVLLVLLVGLLVYVPRTGHSVTAASLTFTVNSTADAPDVHPGDGICADAAGQCTLRAATQEADAQPMGSAITIDVPAGTYGLTLGTLQLTANTITISGALSSTTIISGNNTSAVMGISSTVQATLSQLTIAGGNAGAGNDGGGILNAGQTVLSQSAVLSNTASTAISGGGGEGGGTFNSGTLTVTASIVSNNSAVGGSFTASAGDGIYNSGTLAVTGSTFSGNTAVSSEGGGIYNSGTANVTGSTFSGNSEGNGGSGIYNSGTLTVTSSTFSGNTDSNCISNESSGTLTVTGSTFSGNTGGYGGGIFNNGTANVTGSMFSGNVAASSSSIGGAILNGGTLTVTSSILSHNSAGSNGDGGGIWISGGTTSVTGSTLSGNSANDGGGIYIAGGTLTVTTSAFNNNLANDGGGIYIAGGTQTLSNSTVGSNVAGLGGGLFISSGTVALSYDTLASNSINVVNFAGIIALTGTIVADSTTGPNCAGSVTEGQGYNLDSGTSCGFSQTSDITNTDPLLGPLANNGGPTQTMALLTSSPAIDHGGTSAIGCPTTDQRGLPRPDEAVDSGACDMGSFEAQLGAPPTSTPTSMPTSTPTATPTKTPSPAMLTVNPTSGVYQQTLTLTGTNFASDELVNIYGDSTSHPPLYSATTDAIGSFVLTSTVDQGTYGPHTLIAVGQASGLSATAPFTEEPTTSIAPSSGTQGSGSVISGYGFGAAETVTAYWKSRSGLVLGITKTNVYGTFAGSAAITFTVPVSPTGNYPIISVGQTSDAEFTSTFTLKPYLHISPTSGAHGSKATISGTGYGARETVTVKWDCAKPTCRSTTVLGSKVANGSGNFSGLSVTIPATATVGTYPVGGIGKSSHSFADTFYTVTS